MPRAAVYSEPGALGSPLLSRDATDGRGSMDPSKFRTTAKLGVFLGVFVPTMNTIFGVVVFLRWGWAVGQAGLYQVIVMLALGHAIALLTCASVSAVCTNGEVGPGGAYYIISRALGPEFGGSIGVLFYVSQATGVAFYLIGLAETVLDKFKTWSPIQHIPYVPKDWGGLDEGGHAKYGDTVLVSSGALLVVFIISMMGSSIFAKASFAIFIVIVSALFGAILSMALYGPDSGHIVHSPSAPLDFTGLSMDTLQSNLYQDYYCPKPCTSAEEGLDEGPHGFAGWRVVFGVVMPSMTGILAGANMSGDLADPGRAIPLGTFAAIGFMLISYVLVVLVNAASVHRNQLQVNYEIMQDVCFSPVLVFVGTLCTTFSSALSGLVGTARVLQAIALDFPALRWFAHTSGKDNEPRRAIVASFFLSLATCFLGHVNSIAPIVGNFMLAMFVVLNLACATLELTEAPNFRPKFRLYTWQGAVLGGLLSFGSMFIINAMYAFVTCGICLALFVYISYATTHSGKLSESWGDVNQGLLFRFTTRYLLRMDVRKVHAKFWQPQILLLQPPSGGEDIENSPTGRLIHFANDLKHSGLLLLGHVLVGTLSDHIDRLDEATAERDELVKKLGVKAFTELTVAPSLSLGVQQLTLSAGIGAIRANTVLFGMHRRSTDRSLATGQWAGSSPVHQRLDTSGPASAARLGENDTTASDYVEAVRATLRLGRTVLIARGFDVFSKENVSQILESNTEEWQRRSRIDVAGHGPRAGGKIDVWLPPFGNANVNADDEEARVLVTLQLAQILHSEPFWASHTRLRCCILTTTSAASVQEARLKQIMERCRMYMEIKVVIIEQEPAFMRLKTSMAQESGPTSINASVEVGATPRPEPEPEPEPELEPEAGDTESAYGRHVQDMQLLSSLSNIERNRLLNLMIRKNTLRTTALVFIHQDWHPRLLSTSDSADEGRQDSAETPTRWIEELRVLTDELPPTLMTSPNSSAVTSDV